MDVNIQSIHAGKAVCKTEGIVTKSIVKKINELCINKINNKLLCCYALKF